MDKETRLLIAGLGMPLVLAVAGWVNASAEAAKQEHKKLALSDDFQAYVEYVMVQKGCEP